MAARKNAYQLDQHKTLRGAVGRAKQLESNEQTEALTHLEALRARTERGTPAVDYAQWEEALEELAKAVQGCDGMPSKLARLVRESRVAHGMVTALYPGRPVTGPLVMEVVNDALFQCFMADREVLLVYAAQAEAMKVIAEAGAEIMIRDVRTRHAMSIGSLLKRHAAEADTPISQKVQQALALVLEGEADAEGGLDWAVGQGPGEQE